jgi:hypothetical protein
VSADKANAYATYCRVRDAADDVFRRAKAAAAEKYGGILGPEYRAEVRAARDAYDRATDDAWDTYRAVP